MRYALLWFKRSVAFHLFKSVMTPKLADFAGNCEVCFTPAEVARVLFPEEKVDLEAIGDEFRNLREELGARYTHAELRFPRGWEPPEAQSLLAYLLVRILKPSTVLETGVANGSLSYYLLRAISRNQKGQLYSIEISSDVGGILTEDEKKDWKLIILRTSNVSRSLRKALEKIPPVGLFVHDSEHSYGWQKFEYQSVLPKMDSDSVLASDDVDFSYAFLDFVKRIAPEWKRTVLVSGVNMFGAVRIRPRVSDELHRSLD